MQSRGDTSTADQLAEEWPASAPFLSCSLAVSGAGCQVRLNRVSFPQHLRQQSLSTLPSPVQRLRHAFP